MKKKKMQNPDEIKIDHAIQANLLIQIDKVITASIRWLFHIVISKK